MMAAFMLSPPASGRAETTAASGHACSQRQCADRYMDGGDQNKDRHRLRRMSVIQLGPKGSNAEKELSEQQEEQRGRRSENSRFLIMLAHRPYHRPKRDAGNDHRAD